MRPNFIFVTTLSLLPFLAAGDKLTVSPAGVSLYAGQQQSFVALVNGSPASASTWSLNPPVGTISTLGLYTAPPMIASSQIVVVTATSPNGTAYAKATLLPATISLSPAAVSLNVSQTRQFTATIAGTNNTGITWALKPQLGNLLVTGAATASYTAPKSIVTTQTVEVDGISVFDSTKVAKAAITLVPVVISLAPSSANLWAGQARQFTASVTGSSNQTVNWSIQPAVGMISSAGLYTAPAPVLKAQNVTVTAQSVADPNRLASASVTLRPSPILSPSTVTLGASSSQPFTLETTTGSYLDAIWSVSPAVGTISGKGVYTAPALISSPQTVTITGVNRTAGGAKATINLVPVGISLNPPGVSLIASQTQQFTAAVTAAANTGVTWSLNPNAGTISSTGLYTAPALIPSAQTVSITATSVADPTLSATVKLTLNPIAVSMTPSTASLTQSQTQTLTATVSGSSNTGVTWSSPSVGTLVTNGNAAVYASPSTISAPQNVHISATSMADSTKSATTAISLASVVVVSLAPLTVSLSAGQTQQFTASVTGSSNAAVNWSVSPQVGTISSTGLYTAPATVTTPQNVTVIAQSVGDGTKTASGGIALNTGVTFTMGSTGLTSLAYNGQSMFYPGHGTPSFIQVGLIDSSGNAQTGGTTPTNVVANNFSNSITATYPWGIATTQYTATTNKLLLTITIRNTTSSQTINHFWMFPLGMQFPAIPTNSSTSMAFTVDAPASVWWNYTMGTVDLVDEDVVKPLAVGFWPAQNPPGNQWLLNIYTDPGHFLNPNWPSIKRTIAPGTSDTYTISLRFGDPNSTESTLAGDIFSLYRATFPTQVPLPAQKPIGMLVVSGRFKPTFLTNPRGWFNDPTINVTTPSGIAAFQSRLLQWADGAVSQMQQVGAQGAIIWDIEGQQFNTSYTGDPTQAETIAPELVGVLDAFVKKFTSAGLKIGFTLRPQVFTLAKGTVSVNGTSVQWMSGNAFSPAWAGQQGGGVITIGGIDYTIQSVTSPNSLTLTASAGTVMGVPYFYPVQTNSPNPGAVLSNKIQYAIQRWGASLFYVDSDLAYDGTITPANVFQNLLTTYPGVLIFPEWKNTRHFAYTAPYLEVRRGFTEVPGNILETYPNAIGLINTAGSDLSVASTYNALLESAQRGDILLFEGWYPAPENTYVKQIYSSVSPLP